MDFVNVKLQWTVSGIVLLMVVDEQDLLRRLVTGTMKTKVFIFPFWIVRVFQLHFICFGSLCRSENGCLIKFII